MRPKAIGPNLLLVALLLCVKGESSHLEDTSHDIEDSVRNVDRYFGNATGPVDLHEAIDVLLITYVGATLEEVEEIERRTEGEEKLNEADEERIYVKMHIVDFLDDRYSATAVTTDTLKGVIARNELLAYLEEKMKADAGEHQSPAINNNEEAGSDDI